MVKFYKLKTDRDLILVKTDRDVSESCIAEIAKRMLDFSRRTRNYYNESSILGMGWFDLLFTCLGDVSFKTYWVDNLEVFCREGVEDICLSKVNTVRQHFPEAIPQLRVEFKDFDKWLSLAKCIEEERRKGICVEVRKTLPTGVTVVKYRSKVVDGYVEFLRGVLIQPTPITTTSRVNLAFKVKARAKCRCKWHQLEDVVTLSGEHEGDFKRMSIGESWTFSENIIVTRVETPYTPKFGKVFGVWEVRYGLPSEVQIKEFIIPTSKLRGHEGKLYWLEGEVPCVPVGKVHEIALSIWREAFGKAKTELINALRQFYETLLNVAPKLGWRPVVDVDKIVKVVVETIEERKFGVDKIHNALLHVVGGCRVVAKFFRSLDEIAKFLRNVDVDVEKGIEQVRRDFTDEAFWRRELIWRAISWCVEFGKVPPWLNPKHVVTELVGRAKTWGKDIVRYERVDEVKKFVEVIEELEKLVKLFGRLSGDWEFVNATLRELKDLVNDVVSKIRVAVEEKVVERAVRQEVTVELTVTKPPTEIPTKPVEEPPPQTPQPTPPISPELGVVEGVVVDVETGEPIRGARVELNGNVAFTDEKGLFRFEVEEGRYRVRVEAPNYYPVEKVIDVEAGEAIRLKILLMRKPKAVKELAKSSLPLAIATTSLLLVAGLAMEKLRR